MNDEHQTPEADLASAALDNEVTDAERARIESSPALTDELNFYRTVRSRIADVAVPAARRETALQAALAAFDDSIEGGASERAVIGAPAPTGGSPIVIEPADKVPAAMAPVVSLDHRRRRQFRLLGGAAAAVFVGLLAVGVGRNLGSSTDDDSAALETVSIAKSPVVEVAPGQADRADETSAAGDAAATASAEATAEAADEQASATAAPAPAPAQTSPSPSTSTSELQQINNAATVSPWYGAPSLATDDDVVTFVRSDTFATSSVPAAAQPEDPAGSSAPSTVGQAPADSTLEAVIVNPLAADYPGCDILSSGPSSPAIYGGQQVFVVVGVTDQQISVVEPTACSVVRTIDL